MRPAAPPPSIGEGEEPLGPNEPSRADPPRRARGHGWRARTTTLRTPLGWLGVAAGAVATGLPPTIGILGAAWFGFSGAMDPPLLWFMVAAVLAWLAGIALLVAIALACFRATRALGVGYIIGAAIGAILGAMGFAALSLVGVGADAVTR